MWYAFISDLQTPLRRPTPPCLWAGGCGAEGRPLGQAGLKWAHLTADVMWLGSKGALPGLGGAVPPQSSGAALGASPLGQGAAPGSSSGLRPHLGLWGAARAGAPLLEYWEFLPPSGTANSVWYQHSNAGGALIGLTALSGLTDLWNKSRLDKFFIVIL